MEHSNASIAGTTERLMKLISIKHDEVVLMEKEMEEYMERHYKELGEIYKVLEESRKKVAELEKELAFQTESKRVFKQDMIAAQEKLRAMTITG
jgi:hypothetical protein